MKTIIPQHIGIILDGNRRWAQERNLDTFRGHKAGFDNLKKVANHAFSKGVKILTVFAFSTENWKRQKKEKKGYSPAWMNFSYFASKTSGGISP